MKETHVIKENAKEYVGKARGFLKEFREFAVRGNVIDLAIGIIIGGAFNKIVSSLVADIVMPILGLVIGGVKFTDLKWIIREASPGRDALTFNYGQFIQTTFDFILMAFSVFLIVKVINSVRRYHEKQEKENPTPQTPPAPTKEEILLTEIRDALRAGSGTSK